MRSLTSAWTLHALGAVLLVAAIAGYSADALPVHVLALAMLFSAVGAFSEGIATQVRRRPPHWIGPYRSMVYRKLPRNDVLRRGVLSLREMRARIDAVDWFGDWLPGALAFVGAGLCLVLAVALFRAVGQSMGAPTTGAAALLLGAAIPMLVVQRLLRSNEATDGPAPESLLRIPLLSALVLGAATLFASLGYVWTVWLAMPVIALTGIAAIEAVLRAGAMLFAPAPPFSRRRSPALTWTAALVRLQRPRLDRAGAWFRSAYGVDLSQSWVLAFTLRAALPVAAVLLLLTWLATGITFLRVDERAVVERLGVPTDVLGPGMHVHLPWPLSRVRPVELGVVHEMPIVFSGKPGGRLLAELASAGRSDVAAGMDAEAIPGPTADRLWDASHPGEASYLIASHSGGREGFQIVNVDLRVVFRVPDGKDDALASVYGATDAASLIRVSAGRLLVSHFASSTLDDLLGENRGAFVERFREDLQKQVGDFHAGIDIVGVVVEAIHPPPGAASAYHNVQASQIKADATRFQSRARAFALRGSAQQDALRAVNASRASAAEQLSVARSTKTSFDADARSHVAGPDVFVFENWMSHLRQDLARAHLTVVDHRIDGTETTLDLRPFSAGGTGGTL